MWGIGSRLRRYWLEVAWAAFSAANVAVLFRLSPWETIPFHLVWVSLSILYGYRVWREGTTAAVLVVVCLATGAGLTWSVVHSSGNRYDELTEVPLMAGMFVAMVWHARRHRAATEEVRRLAEGEHRLLERQREFVRDASHELRTPITVARGHAELIRAAVAGSAIAEDADVVLDELSRLGRISERLLILVAAGHPGFLRPTDFGLGPFLASIARRWAAAARRRWRTDLRAEGVLRADQERLAVAVDALVENAVKFTREGDVVAVVGRQDGPGALIEVRDAGEGIPSDQLERIFEPFSRADGGRARHDGGTGLGLAIVRAIVEAHGGWVEVESAVGQGSTFRIRLPGFRPTTPRPPSPPRVATGSHR
jgi:signal transduction histidine kinase